MPGGHKGSLLSSFCEIFAENDSPCQGWLPLCFGDLPSIQMGLKSVPLCFVALPSMNMGHFRKSIVPCLGVCRLCSATQLRLALGKGAVMLPTGKHHGQGLRLKVQIRGMMWTAALHPVSIRAQIRCCPSAFAWNPPQLPTCPPQVRSSMLGSAYRVETQPCRPILWAHSPHLLLSGSQLSSR